MTILNIVKNILTNISSELNLEMRYLGIFMIIIIAMIAYSFIAVIIMNTIDLFINSKLYFWLSMRLKGIHKIYPLDTNELSKNGLYFKYISRNLVLVTIRHGVSEEYIKKVLVHVKAQKASFFD